MRVISRGEIAVSDTIRHRSHGLQSGFHSNMSEVAAKRDPPLSKEWMQIFGFAETHGLPQTITFNNWVHPSWTVHADDGTVFETISNMSLTITKAQIISTGEIVLTYYFRADMTNNGWSPNAPGTPNSGYGVLRLDLKTSAGGIVWTDDMTFRFACGTSGSQFASKRIPIDIFDAIAGAHISHTVQTYWQC
jgi:hypothetical protein